MKPTWESLYRSHLDMVFRLCSRYCRDREAAEDMAQEVFIRIHRGLETFRGDSAPATWIYRLAVNTCLDHLRAVKRRGGLRQAYLDEMVVENLAGNADEALAKLVLGRILEPFRPEVRRILFLTLAEGLSYGEAAEVLGLSRDAVAKTATRALRKIRVTGGHSQLQTPPVPVLHGKDV